MGERVGLKVTFRILEADSLPEVTPTGGKQLLLPHLLLLEEVLQERLVTWAHFGLQARLKRHRTQQLPRQPVLYVCRSVLQRHGSLGEQTNTIRKNGQTAEALCQPE